jgi:voltage-gated potassium channel
LIKSTKRQTSVKSKIARILDVSTLNEPIGKTVDIFLIILILLNTVAIILESVSSIFKQYQAHFFYFEVFSVAVFSTEYILRVWSCTESQDKRFHQPFSGRLKFMRSPMAIIDLLAILPFYLSALFAIDLRFLRVFRLLRVFKLTRYSGAMGLLLTVFKEEASSFLAAFFVLFILLIIASSGIYLIEHKIQPDAFGSIPSAMWWAMATLTTVGYGDVTPITPMGKFFGSFITIIGMGMVALPAGILASGFSEQLRIRRSNYQAQVDIALDDGVLTENEKNELEKLRRELGLSREDAKHVLHKTQQMGASSEKLCPMCHGTGRRDTEND